MTQKKLTSDDLQALYDALPIKQHMDVIRSENAKIDALMTDFAMTHFGYSSVEDVKTEAYKEYAEINGKELARAVDVSDHLDWLVTGLIEEADEE